jgi:N-acetylglutamate synthase-like GNAT family acetyltransferase
MNLLDREDAENTCRQIEGHLHSLYRLVGDVKDIGNALLVSNRRIPSSNYNHAREVNALESKIDELIDNVAKHYQSMGINPCFSVSPTTRPKTFSNYLLRAGFELVLKEDVMVCEGKGEDVKLNPEVKVVVNDGSLTDVWTDVSMKGFGVPATLRESLIDMYRKAGNFKGTRSYLGYFQGRPAGSCGLVSLNKVGGIFSVATAPEHRKRGVATALLSKAIADSVSMGNNLLYLITTKGSDAEKLYTSLGFKSAYTHCRYELHSQEK